MLYHPIVASIGAGAISGALVLGAGGRVAMRAYAIADWQTPYFTPAGSLTVLLVGMSIGATTGLWYGWSARWFPARRVLRIACFWLGLMAVTAFVLWPVSVRRAEVFAPLVVVHGTLLSLGVRRLDRAHLNALPATD